MDLKAEKETLEALAKSITADIATKKAQLKTINKQVKALTILIGKANDIIAK